MLNLFVQEGAQTDESEQQPFMKLGVFTSTITAEVNPTLKDGDHHKIAQGDREREREAWRSVKLTQSLLNYASSRIPFISKIEQSLC